MGGSGPEPQQHLGKDRGEDSEKHTKPRTDWPAAALLLPLPTPPSPNLPAPFHIPRVGSEQGRRGGLCAKRIFTREQWKREGGRKPPTAAGPLPLPQSRRPQGASVCRPLVPHLTRLSCLCDLAKESYGARAGRISPRLCFFLASASTSAQHEFHLVLSLTPQHLSLALPLSFCPLSIFTSFSTFPLLSTRTRPFCLFLNWSWFKMQDAGLSLKGSSALLSCTCFARALMQSLHVPQMPLCPLYQGTEVPPLPSPQTGRQSDFSLMPEAILPGIVS